MSSSNRQKTSVRESVRGSLQASEDHKKSSREPDEPSHRKDTSKSKMDSGIDRQASPQILSSADPPQIES